MPAENSELGPCDWRTVISKIYQQNKFRNSYQNGKWETLIALKICKNFPRKKCKKKEEGIFFSRRPGTSLLETQGNIQILSQPNSWPMPHLTAETSWISHDKPNLGAWNSKVDHCDLTWSFLDDGRWCWWLERDNEGRGNIFLFCFSTFMESIHGEN